MNVDYLVNGQYSPNTRDIGVYFPQHGGYTTCRRVQDTFGNAIWRHPWQLITKVAPGCEGMGTVSPGDPGVIVRDGEWTSIAATPADGYEFSHWTNDLGEGWSNSYPSFGIQLWPQDAAVPWQFQRDTSRPYVLYAHFKQKEVTPPTPPTPQYTTLKLYIGNPKLSESTAYRAHPSIGIGYDSGWNSIYGYNTGDTYMAIPAGQREYQAIMKNANLVSGVEYGLEGNFLYLKTTVPIGTKLTIRAMGTSTCYEFAGFTTEPLDFTSAGFDVTNRCTSMGSNCYKLTDNDVLRLTNGISFIGDGNDHGNRNGGRFYDSQCHIATVDMSTDRTLYAWFAKCKHYMDGWVHVWNKYGSYSSASEAEIVAASLLNSRFRIGSSCIANPTSELLTVTDLDNNPYYYRAKTLTDDKKHYNHKAMVYYNKFSNGDVELSYCNDGAGPNQHPTFKVIKSEPDGVYEIYTYG